MGNKLLRLLQIDDSSDDRLLVKEAIALTHTPFSYYEADCIEEAVPFFKADGPRAAHCPQPSLVLLDYDLKAQTGLDFLYWLRMVREIKSVPVVMFSGSPDKNHVANCYATGANYFVKKPKDLLRLKIVVRTLHLSLLPHHGHCPIVFLNEYQPDPREERFRF